MISTHKKIPASIRDFLLSTLKLELLVIVVSILCGYAYGWDIGTKVWAAFSVIVLVAQCWSCRTDIVTFIRGDKHIE